MISGTEAAIASGDEPVDVDTGRQLFVDDHLIAYSGLNRTFHTPQISPESPVMRPETPLELNGGVMPATHLCSDGVWFDPADGLFKMWYMAGYDDALAFAFSHDGLKWTRPSLSLEPGTNRVLGNPPGYRRSGATVWLDHEAPASERFKLFVYFRRTDGGWPRGNPDPFPADPELTHTFVSPDGIAWNFHGPTGPCGDNSSMFYNPFARKWVFSIRSHSPRLGRMRTYVAVDSFSSGLDWAPDEPRFLAAADRLDRPDHRLQFRPELYKLDCAPYESLMIGLFAIYDGPPNDQAYRLGVPKTVDLHLGTSRDGLRWDRPQRAPFIACSRKPGDWNRGYLHAAGGVCLVVGNELRFYFSGFSGHSPAQGAGPYAGASIGYATLRRDGFASLDGPGVPMSPPGEHVSEDDHATAAERPGLLVTRCLRFSGGRLFANAVVPEIADLRAALLTPAGDAIAGFGFDDCLPVRGDSTGHRVRWRGNDEVGRLAGDPVRLAFRLPAGQLYSFWFSSSPHGGSNGFVAAGGPGFTGATDTTGR
jgi:hypothetical protein